jgi:hypothetical protein
MFKRPTDRFWLGHRTKKLIGEEMEDLFIAFFWTGPIGLGVFFMGIGVLLWGISKFRSSK